MTRKEAIKEAKEILATGSIDLEEGETKQDWINVYLDCLKEDGIIK